MPTSRSGEANAKGRSAIPSTTENVTVAAAIVTVRMTKAVAVVPRPLRKPRSASRKSIGALLNDARTKETKSGNIVTFPSESARPGAAAWRHKNTPCLAAQTEY
jgi:hypothetical protein